MSSIPVRATLLAALVAGVLPRPLAAQALPAQSSPAQSSLGSLWKACGSPFPTTSIVLGGKTFSATDVQTLGANEVEVGSRISPRIVTPKPDPNGPVTTPPATQSASSLPTDRLFCMEATGATFPQPAASHALVLLVAATTDVTFLRVEIYSGTSLAVASEGAASQHSMLLGSNLAKLGAGSQLLIVVSREDAGAQPAKFRAWIEQEPLAHDTSFTHGKGWFVKSLSEGHAFRYVADTAAYNRLLTFARCDWVSHDARQRQYEVNPASATARQAAGCFEPQMDVLKSEIYPLVSNLTGRSLAHEQVDGQPRASLSEPMVVFFGLGGTNKILLLDCRDAGNAGPARGCLAYAEPWQTTLQRARYVWAVYIEDEQTPFNTSIDVEFKPRAPSVDYEEYDPLGLAYPQVALATPDAGGNRVLRIGYRRLRIREPPVAVQLAFSRSGPNYGLRQWVRVYRQFSARWWVVSGGVLVPADNNAITHIELTKIFPVGGGPAVTARIEEELPLAPIYATMLWRWPQVRGFADNQAQANKRLVVNLIPDIIGGFSLPPRRHNSYLVGGSWPILADRLSFVMAAKVFRDEQPREGFAVGQYVPVETTEADVRGTPQRHVTLVFGLAIELVRSR